MVENSTSNALVFNFFSQNVKGLSCCLMKLKARNCPTMFNSKKYVMHEGFLSYLRNIILHIEIHENKTPANKKQGFTDSCLVQSSLTD